MQMLIDITPEAMDDIKNGRASRCFLQNKILNGKPLPKGHGDLIERNKLLEKIWDVDCRCGYVQVIDRQDIEDAPTIIEADKEDAE